MESSGVVAKGGSCGCGVVPVWFCDRDRELGEGELKRGLRNLVR